MRLAIFGSTGSIGEQTLDVVRAHPHSISVVALAAARNAERLIAQAVEFRPAAVAVSDTEAGEQVREALAGRCRVEIGPEAVEALGSCPEADAHVIAITGIAGLRPMLRAIEAGRHVAFATKEPLVAAGDLVMDLACRSGAVLAPIDSEISAIWQCARSARAEAIRRILLTASGGPFRTWPADRIYHATVSDALAHPTWTMGAKITVDSASLMNKGLEVIECMRFFGVPLERLEVLVHPQSIVHSMVEFVDGSVLAQLGCPDMRLPIQYALLGPERLPNPFARLDWSSPVSLEFERPDLARFPCLRLAYEAAALGGTATTVLNAANEVANAEFVAGHIPFGRIALAVESALAQHSAQPAGDLATVEEADAWARSRALEYIAATR